MSNKIVVKRIVVVDSNPEFASLLRRILAGLGHSCTCLQSVEQAIIYITTMMHQNTPPDIVLARLGIGTDHRAGVKLAAYINYHNWNIRFILTEASTPPDLSNNMSGIKHFLQMPFGILALKELIDAH